MPEDSQSSAHQQQNIGAAARRFSKSSLAARTALWFAMFREVARQWIIRGIALLATGIFGSRSPCDAARLIVEDFRKVWPVELKVNKAIVDA